MTDHITRLKEALEAGPTECGAWRWWPCKGGDYKPGSDYAQLASGKAHVAQIRIQSITEADLRFIAAANPVAIRSLLAALDEAEKHARRWKTISQEFRVMSPHIDGNHCWVLRSSDRLRGPTMEAAVDAIAAQETPPADGGGQSGGKSHFSETKCLSRNDISVVDGGAGQDAIAAQEGGKNA